MSKVANIIGLIEILFSFKQKKYFTFSALLGLYIQYYIW